MYKRQQYGKGESAVCNSIPAIEGVTVQESNSTAADKVKVAYGCLLYTSRMHLKNKVNFR